MFRRRDDDTTLQMFYQWYYAPNFNARFPGHATVELFELSAIEKWSLELSKNGRSGLPSPLEVVPREGLAAPSPEYIALSKAAVQGDTLIWTLVGLTGAVHSCLPLFLDVVSVLALVFSFLNDPQDESNNQSLGLPDLVLDLLPIFRQSYKYSSNSRNLPTAAITSRFQRCRYNPKSVLGKRLLEDVGLWLEIAADAGLLRELNPFEMQAHDEIEIACTLLGLLQQSWPWAIRMLPSRGGRFDRLVALRKQCLWIGSDTKSALRFLRQLQGFGISLDFDDDTTKDLPLHDLIRQELAGSDHNFGKHIRSGSWWVSLDRFDFLETGYFRDL